MARTSTRCTGSFVYEMYMGFQLPSVAWLCEKYPELYPDYLNLVNVLWKKDSTLRLETLTGALLGLGVPDCEEHLQNRIIARQLQFADMVFRCASSNSSAQKIALDFVANFA